MMVQGIAGDTGLIILPGLEGCINVSYHALGRAVSLVATLSPSSALHALDVTNYVSAGWLAWHAACQQNRVLQDTGHL